MFVRARYRYGRLSRKVSEAESVTAPAEEDIDKTADDVAATPLAPQRGALKKKARQGHASKKLKCPVQESKSFGPIKLQIAKDKSYVLMCVEGKWRLLVEFTNKACANHAACATKAYQYLADHKSAKHHVVTTLKQKLIAECGNITRRPAANFSPRLLKKPTASSDSLDALAEQTDDDDWRDDADDRANDSDDAYAWLDA